MGRGWKIFGKHSQIVAGNDLESFMIHNKVHRPLATLPQAPLLKGNFAKLPSLASRWSWISEQERPSAKTFLYVSLRVLEWIQSLWQPTSLATCMMTDACYVDLAASQCCSASGETILKLQAVAGDANSRTWSRSRSSSFDDDRRRISVFYNSPWDDVILHGSIAGGEWKDHKSHRVRLSKFLCRF